MNGVSNLEPERHMNGWFREGSSAAFDDGTVNAEDAPMTLRFTKGLLLVLMAAVAQVNAQATTAAQLQLTYQAAAGSPAQADRGRAFFVNRHGGEWSCASCHGQVPTGAGRHAVTAKPIDPLAPAFNPKAFTDERRVEKWFRRNCKDVVQRECTPAEKADVLAWLQSLR
jgi:hypothetical protein